MTIDNKFPAIILIGGYVHVKINFVTRYKFRYEGAILRFSNQDSNRELLAVLSTTGSSSYTNYLSCNESDVNPS